MSWGLNALRQDMPPERRRGEVFSDLPFHSITAANGVETFEQMATFRHWDQRVWTARIVKDGPGHAMTLSSPGCRLYQIVGRNPMQLRITAASFANLGRDLYNRLIADARPTQSHPCDARLVVMQARILTPRNEVHYSGASRGYPQRTTVPRYDSAPMTGLGRIDSKGRIVALPRTPEIEMILSDICQSGCNPVVPAGINEVAMNIANLNRRQLQENMEQLEADLLDDEALDRIFSNHSGEFQEENRPPSAGVQFGRIIELDDNA